MYYLFGRYAGKVNAGSGEVKRFILYTSINTKSIEKSLSNIEAWKNYSMVAEVKLIQNDTESREISRYINGIQQIKVVNTKTLSDKCQSMDNPKGLPNIKDLLLSMRHTSLEDCAQEIHLYLNSDIVIRGIGFFESLGSMDNCMYLVHRRDVWKTPKGFEERGSYIHGIDAFCVSSLMLREIVYGSSDMFYLGLPGWDQYLPLLCWMNRWQQRFITTKFAIHEMHDTSNPGSYILFANRLIVLYMCEYYMKMRSRRVRRIVSNISRVKGNNWITSICHKIIVFPALRSFGWKIQRKSHLKTDLDAC